MRKKTKTISNITGKRVLITGGAGFIGRYLVKSLIDNGALVGVVDLKRKPKNFATEVEYIQGDVGDSKIMEKVLVNTDYCYHFAAKYGGGQFIYDNAAYVLDYNSRLLSSVFNSAVSNKLKRVIFPSSSLVYSESLKKTVHEEDLWKYPPTRNPYGFMKLTGETYCHNYWKQYKLPFTIVRMFNVYGIGDEHLDHVVPSFARLAVKNSTIKIIGNGTEVRAFTHVSDVVDGLIKVISSNKAVNKEYNLSSEEVVSINNLLKIIWKLCGRNSSIKVRYIPVPDTLPSHRLVSSAKIKKELRWKPTILLENGLEEVVEWMRTLKK